MNRLHSYKAASIAPIHNSAYYPFTRSPHTVRVCLECRSSADKDGLKASSTGGNLRHFMAHKTLNSRN